MLDVGLIGLGPDWDSLYRPALLRQGGRINVRALFTAVSSRAAAVCGGLECDLAASICDLVARPAVKAVIVLDSAWFSVAVAEFACRAGKPVLLVDPVHDDWSQLRSLSHLADELGTMIIPDLVHRYTPATARLRELLATRLGKPRHLDVQLTSRGVAEGGLPPSRFLADSLAVGLDWCHSVANAIPVSLRGTEGAVPAEGLAVDVQFGPLADRSPPPTARITIGRTPQSAEPGETPAGLGIHFQARVECQRGSAVLTAADQIGWSAEGEPRVEQLSTERAAFDVLLDHFARRVVGGLIPIASLDEGLRARAWAQAARQAVGTQSALRLDRRTGLPERP